MCVVETIPVIAMAISSLQPQVATALTEARRRARLRMGRNGRDLLGKTFIIRGGRWTCNAITGPFRRHTATLKLRRPPIGTEGAVPIDEVRMKVRVGTLIEAMEQGLIDTE